MDHFERLGLPRRFSLDPAAAERAYLARSRELHPDFHAGGSAADQLASLDLSAALNDAYATLTDPLRRAEYLCELLGGPTAAGEKGQDPAFLMAAMEYRERAEGGEADAVRAEVAAAEADTLSRVGRVLDGSPTGTDLTAARRELNAVRTLRSLVRDLG
jgi:molecular chaperone HscB